MGRKREYLYSLGSLPRLDTRHYKKQKIEIISSSNKTNKQKLQIVMKNKSSRDINSLREEWSVISFPSLIGSYRNDHDIYESKRQNNPANEV